MAIFAHGTTLSYGDGEDPEVFTKVDRVQDFTVPRGQRDEIEVTDHDSGGVEEFIAGLKRMGEMSFSIHYRPRNESHAKLTEFHDTGEMVTWQVEFVNDIGDELDKVTATLTAWVRQFEVQAPVNGAYTANVSLRVSGDVDFDIPEAA